MNEVIKYVRMTNTTTGNKEYRLSILKENDGTYSVLGKNGAIGSNLVDQPKEKNVTLDVALKAFDKVIKEKTHYKKGYVLDENPDASVAAIIVVREDTGLRPHLLIPIDVSEAPRYIKDPNWGIQQKYNGERLMVKRLNNEIISANKLGIRISVPEIEKTLSEIPGEWSIDGEHMNSTYYIFDMIKEPDGKDIAYLGAKERNNILGNFFAKKIENLRFVELITEEKAKQELFDYCQKNQLEGIVAKKLNAPYVGELKSRNSNQVKIKNWNSLSCIAGSKNNGKKSFEMYLLDGNKQMISVGSVKTKDKIPKEGEIVEIKYLHVKRKGGALIQPQMDCIRMDVDTAECTVDQIVYEGTTV